jgi:hypothetical protein
MVEVYRPRTRADAPAARKPTRPHPFGEWWVREWVEQRWTRRGAMRAARRIAHVLNADVLEVTETTE